MVVFPPFRLDREAGQLWKGDALLTLRRKPFAILSHLAAHPKKLVTQAELLAEVWRGAVVSDSALRSHLHELRQVLGKGVIETVIGRGYRFVAQVREEPEALAASAAAARERCVDPRVVAREAELAQLQAAFERACSGRRQTCFVTGEPGIGKSTLVRAFLGGLDPEAVLVGVGSCFEQHGTPEPYFAIIEALLALTRSLHGAEVRAALVRHAPAFVVQVPQLVNDAQLGEATRRGAAGSESRQLRQIGEALEALCVLRPLVIVLEDLQWSDVATIDLLALLAQRDERAKLLVIGTSRHADIKRAEHPLNPVMRSLVARAGARLLALPQMGVAGVQRLIDRRFPGHAFPALLAELVARITGGTPLYVVALLDELAGRGMLAERDGQWALVVALEDVEAHRPASVKQLIDMQLDRLTAAEQRVLEAASIVGAEFATGLVAAAIEAPPEEVGDTCNALVRRAAFLREEAGARYGFTHALIQEVCSERSSPARRQRWHRLVAEALLRDPRGVEEWHLLAKHFDAAGDAARAIPAYAAASRHAAQRYASSDAVALCARALALLPQLPDGRTRDMEELELLGAMCGYVNSNSFSAAFAGRRAEAVYERAIAIARSLGDPALLYRALTQLCNYHMIVAEYDSSAALTAELERIELAHPIAPALLHAGIFARAYIAFFQAELTTALALFERLVPAEHAESEFHGNPAGRALALSHLACVSWVVGEPERALEEALAGIALADAAQIPILQALGRVVLGRLRYLRRDPLDAFEHETEPAVRAASLDLGLLTEANAFALWAEALRGPLPLSAIAPLRDSLRERLKAVSTCSTLVAQMVIEVLRLSGHLAEARALSDEIIAFATVRSERVYLPELLCTRAALREATDADAACRDYADAVALAEATGAHGLARRARAALTAFRARSC